jgi:Polyketide cyclase / dehydrase and lipid transport
MLKLIGGFAVVAIAVILILAAMKPSTFVVERSVTINAAPEKIAPLINDFHNWDAWSPWAKLDPAMKTTYSGPASGVGSVYEWEGNSKVGKGRMEMRVIHPTKISIKLDFLKPFEGHNTADFVLVPEGNTATRVTWVMYGPLTFIPGKLMSVFTTMDNMIGDDFQRGLANLKAAAEK